MELPTELVRGTVVPIVLALLHEEPRYGYEIVKLVNARTQGLLKWKEGTLYPALHRLENERLIRSKWQTVGSAKPRKYYHLTRKGAAELAKRTREWQQFTGAVDGLLLTPAPAPGS